MTMLERVAKAIYEGRNGAGAKAWASQPKSHHEPYLLDAHAAIEAMREPTSVMANAVDIEVGGDFEVAGSFVGSYEAVQIWQAMIDAALQPPEAGKP